LKGEKGAPTNQHDWAAKFNTTHNFQDLERERESSQVRETRGINLEAKSLKTAEHPELEALLAKWVLSAPANDIPVLGEMIKEQAKTYAGKMDIKDLEFSNGWLSGFIARYNLGPKGPWRISKCRFENCRGGTQADTATC